MQKISYPGWVALILIVAVFGIPSQGNAYERYKNVVKYDRYFSKYTKRYFGPQFDWRCFKAQAIAESRLQEAARSYVGALGIMQIMPRTFNEIKKRNPKIQGPRFHPRWNIAAGIYYDRTLWKLWKAERPFQDRLDFMFGSYNAGKGNIIKAQKTARRENLDENRWSSIEKTLPRITGPHSKETIGYVEKINYIMGVLR